MIIIWLILKNFITPLSAPGTRAIGKSYCLTKSESWICFSFCSKFHDPLLQNVTQINTTLELQEVQFHKSSLLTHFHIFLSGTGCVCMCVWPPIVLLSPQQWVNLWRITGEKPVQLQKGVPTSDKLEISSEMKTPKPRKQTRSIVPQLHVRQL